MCGIHVCRDWFEFCGYAFCERLNPPLSNDAFMSSVSSSPSLSLPSSLSPLIKRMALYASDIKRHQSPHTVYLRCFLSFALLFRAFFLFFCTHITCLQTPFDVELRQTVRVCLSINTLWHCPCLTGKSVYKSPLQVHFPHLQYTCIRVSL